MCSSGKWWNLYICRSPVAFVTFNFSGKFPPGKRGPPLHLISMCTGQLSGDRCNQVLSEVTTGNRSPKTGRGTIRFSAESKRVEGYLGESNISCSWPPARKGRNAMAGWLIGMEHWSTNPKVVGANPTPVRELALSWCNYSPLNVSI